MIVDGLFILVGIVITFLLKIKKFRKMLPIPIY